MKRMEIIRITNGKREVEFISYLLMATDVYVDMTKDLFLVTTVLDLLLYTTAQKCQKTSPIMYNSF